MSKEKMLCILCIAVLIIATTIFLIVHQSRLSDKEFTNQLAELSSEFTCTAHTGCMDTEENSIEAIEAGIKNGAQIVEFDLNFNQSNEPVLSHNSPIGGEVTLDEAFKKVSEYDNIKVNVDLKSCASLDKIKMIAQKYGILDRIFFTGVNDEFLESVQKADLGIPYYLNVNVNSRKKNNSEYMTSLVQKVKNSGTVGINLNKDNVSAMLVETFHDNGLLVSVWTVDKKREMQKVVSYLPDNITTRNPKLLNKIIYK